MIKQIQLLPAVAAVAVVLAHTQIAIYAKGSNFDLTVLSPGAAGVDLFFIISGFVMVYSSRSLFGNGRSWRTFYSLRVIRIVPLYWLATALWIANRVSIGQEFPDTSRLLASLLFIPWPVTQDAIAMYPVYEVGWTLNYEMFFYAVLAAVMFLPRQKALVCASTGLIAVVAASHLIGQPYSSLRYWGDSIVIEFALGMFSADVYLRGYRLPTRIGLCVALSGLAATYSSGMIIDIGSVWTGSVTRLLTYGLSCLLLFVGFVFAKDLFAAKGWGVSGKAVLLVGDASYSLYLFHDMALFYSIESLWSPVLGSVGRPFAPAVLAIAMLAAAVLVSVLIHLCIERPVTATLKRLVRDPMPSLAANPAE